MVYVLFEDSSHLDLRPFTFTRPVWALRCGILTGSERWSAALRAPLLSTAYDYLAPLYASTNFPENLSWINGKLSPDEALLSIVSGLAPGEYAITGDTVLAARFEYKQLPADWSGLLDPPLCEEMGLKKVETEWNGIALRQLPDLFQHNAALIRRDFETLTAGKRSEPISDPHTAVYGRDNIFVEPGARIRAAILDAESGPIYIGPHVQIQPGAIISGAHAFGAHSVLSMGAKLRGDSSFGPYVKVGGEVANSVIMGYANKAHDGYLGNSVLGYWCNLGAGTETSNLKNTYEEVKLWNYRSGSFRKTGSSFCGLMMGDHSKSGINSMFNTGTVVGVSANIFGEGYPRVLIPSFSWGGASGFSTYALQKALFTMERVMARRQMELSEAERSLYRKVFELTAPNRPWEIKA